MNICIRADGGNFIGMGHVMRTLVLAIELSGNHTVFYACKVDTPLTEKYKAGINKIKKEGFVVVEIHEETLYDDIVKIKADCILTDSYDVDEEYFNILKAHFKLTGCIYDTNATNMHFNVDFFINPDAYAKELKYVVNSTTKMLIGSDFVILREGFLKCKPKGVKEKITNILITLGGSDYNNLTEKILKSIFKLKEYTFHIIVGPAFKYKDRLFEYRSDKIKIYYDINNMQDVMVECDVAISACGTTLYELMYCGVPIIGIIAAANQIIEAEAMEKIGAIIISNELELRQHILQLTTNKRVKMNYIGKDLVDGMGCKRIVSIMENLYNIKNISR
ncbi:UDP-2,4-diacetamido-2,4,6-trideoxy-beta-L-altropyranose hydrolase [Clostridium estertheticum]|uniref:UDP-2,4-diacetamido-2,4, 6-trideoxy-beta-L-altropyranose hydrolase n=1 Tax=Clostridium estertheticum TaxID=238834 RepID=A0A5N7IQH6_9CLOT|nr:UDP-2,4-diacetamido-2,4,6-trideoxy-beta-L-altropyranose hydrolase [Clostridium estertheticum]MPQ32553.1 UDP-2,4-diacetamido-2,4,6-trideoxy-beta-L-altropyranose hydrolase [Clostridium estertheticum]MPQ63212.1 UDP-2,4-diacetamido-2,4,6-trideoxy-beta-L-altropyranose hydrolase [Clostridium estertheticum]